MRVTDAPYPNTRASSVSVRPTVDMDTVLQLFVYVVVCVVCVLGDTPANCTYEEVKGTWIFHVGNGGFTKDTVDCSSPQAFDYIKKVKLDLLYPDEAIDEFGNKVFWTMVYNQGFEVVINGRKYFAFSKYEGDLKNSTSICSQTMPGWSHDVLGHDWACYTGHKAGVELLRKPASRDYKPLRGVYRRNPEYIAAINAAQDAWRATHYAQYDGRPLEALVRRAGGRNSRAHRLPRAARPSADTLRLAASLPEHWDWRDVGGVNYVSPVRAQGDCGSCYAFASLAMNEARLRIATNNTQAVVLSPQDVVQCSMYSQGCDGGFPYLIGGKYAEDFGLVEEQCNPYTWNPDAGVCNTSRSEECGTSKRHYSTNYRYVGGYYGASNEAEMLVALVKNGPLAVGFEVYQDLAHYRMGIYHHTRLLDRFNPFELTNHAVLVVGYGVQHGGPDDGAKYWVVKNSWGTDWGEHGYFRILRGVDECAFESVAVESFPLPKA